MEFLGLTLLLIEDEVAIRRMFEEEFKELGFAVYSFSCIQDTFCFFEKDARHFDICLLDLRLPDGDGFDILNYIQVHYLHTPVILMNSNGNKNTVIEALKKGAYDYLEKPFSLSNELLPILNRAMAAVKLQKENNALNDQILHNSKLAALGELSATVLHDIRGPLSLIQMVCEELREAELIVQKPNEFDLEKSVAQIEKACHKIKILGDHLRNFSREDTHERSEEKLLSALIEDSLFMVQQKIRSLKIRVKKIIPTELEGLKIFCFPNKLEQVFMNLASNACDAMSEIETRDLTIALKSEAQNIFIEISDSGTGMSDEIQLKIFDSFFTTKPRGQGTGLGLKIVRNIIGEHGGELHLASVEGKGTTFTVQLPRAGLAKGVSVVIPV